MITGNVTEGWPVGLAAAAAAAMFGMVTVYVGGGDRERIPFESFAVDPGRPTWPALPLPKPLREQRQPAMRQQGAAAALPGVVLKPAAPLANPPTAATGPLSAQSPPEISHPSDPDREPPTEPAPVPHPTPEPTPAPAPRPATEPTRVVSGAAPNRWPGRDKHDKGLPPGQGEQPTAQPQAAEEAYAETEGQAQKTEHPQGAPPGQEKQEKKGQD
jgi:hypothetical protein